MIKIECFATHHVILSKSINRFDTMKKVYFSGACSTNIRMLKELNLDSVNLQDIKIEPISINPIDEMAKTAGSYKVLFSRKAINYKTLALTEIKFSEADYKKYIFDEDTFIKRQVTMIYENIFNGNSKKNISALKQN